MDSSDFSSVIQNILKNPNAKGQIENLFNGLTSNNDKDNKDINIKALLSGADDNRISLLNSIKPYMNDKRKNSIDTVVNFLRILNITGNFKGKD